MSDLKKRINKELEFVFSESEEILGFFSFTVLRSKMGKPIATITWICDKIIKDQGDAISKKLFELTDLIKPLFNGGKDV